MDLAAPAVGAWIASVSSPSDGSSAACSSLAAVTGTPGGRLTDPVTWSVTWAMPGTPMM